MSTYEEGKVYLRDTRTGSIYPYERFLAADKNFAPCVPNPVNSVVADTTPTVIPADGMSVEEFNQEVAAHQPLENTL